VGGTRDYVVMGSDSGKISILEFDVGMGKFKKVHEETFGKTGCRRIVPGQMLAKDPKGRAVMIGAIERNKLVYVLNRDVHANLTISSPLEANNAHTLCYDICGVDVGFENPLFACIEVNIMKPGDDFDHKDPNPDKQLTYYELDLGLNNVTRKASEPIDSGQLNHILFIHTYNTHTSRFTLHTSRTHTHVLHPTLPHGTKRSHPFLASLAQARTCC
jgi:splicing factor 3B subunit 3